MSKELAPLEALEKVKTEIKKVEGRINVFIKLDIKTIEIALKALEIIMTKQVDINALRMSNNHKEYYSIQLFGAYLGQEEYDLLKEVC